MSLNYMQLDEKEPEKIPSDCGALGSLKKEVVARGQASIPE